MGIEQEEETVKKTITLYLAMGGDRTAFKIKIDTPLQKMFSTYENRMGVTGGSYYYIFDGQRLKGSDTAKMLELEDEDQIDAMAAQMGGR